MPVAQWTIDPRKVASGEVCDKAIVLFEARPRVIVRTSNRGFRVPSWTKRLKDLAPADRRDTYCQRCRTDHNGLWYHQIVTADSDGETVIFKVICDCLWAQTASPDDDPPCHHAYGVALELRSLEFKGQRIVTPADRPRRKPAKRVRSRPLTVIPGGKT